MHNGINTDKQVQTLAIAASGEEMRRASEWLTTALRQRDVPEPLVECLELAFHEVLANVLAHGGSAARAEPIRICIEVREKTTAGEAHVKVSDAGICTSPWVVTPVYSSLRPALILSGMPAILVSADRTM